MSVPVRNNLCITFTDGNSLQNFIVALAAN